jgi:hypothetical protein
MTQTGYAFKANVLPNYKGAQLVAPIVAEVLGVPQSIVDLGGGGGGWCKAFQELGTAHITCIDHPSIRPNDLLIDPENFLGCDLSQSFPPVRKCDLAMSIEFAEHVPTHRSPEVVAFLSRSSTKVLFSAALPRQGGKGHINEQRPEFWQQLFEAQDFVLVDAIRPRILFNKQIKPWIRQNLYLYIHKSALAELNLNSQDYQFIPADQFELVWKGILHKPLGLSELLRQFPRAFSQAFRKRMGLPYQEFQLKDWL